MGIARDPLRRAVIEVVNNTSALALLIELREGRVVVASPSAREFLAPDGDPIGTRIEDYVEGTTSGALQMVADGTLDSYETRRSLRSGQTAEEVRAWVKACPNPEGPPTHALVVINPSSDRGEAVEAKAEAHVAVAGTIDYRLHITHVTSDVEALLGFPARNALRRPFLDLFVYSDALHVLAAVAEAGRRNHSVSVAAHAQRADGTPLFSHLIVASLVPRQNFGFAIVPTVDPLEALSDADRAGQLLPQLAASMRAAEIYRRAPDVNDADAELLSRLSVREVEIIAMLMRGDRVPAIAQTLHVSQSTVRNHLSSVFRKFDVKSQQELIERLRGERASGSS